MRPASAAARAGPRRAGQRGRLAARAAGRASRGGRSPRRARGCPGSSPSPTTGGRRRPPASPAAATTTEWHGEFEARPGLAPETAWIEVLGQRIELPAAIRPGVEVWVEPRADQDLARATCRPGWPAVRVRIADALETSIEALVAAGALAAGDPAIAEVRAVAGGLSRGRAPPRGQRGAARAVAVPAGPARPGRRPRGPRRGGRGHPAVRRVTLAVLAVQSTDEQFSADVETVPGLPHWHGRSGAVDEPMLAWWAADDRGQHYLGQPAAVALRRGPGRRPDRVLARAGPGGARCSTSCPPR